MKILSKRNITLFVSIVLILLITFVVSSYPRVWGQVFSKSEDISKELLALSKRYYGSKYHIWYGSFENFGILIFLLLPIATSSIYAKSYYNKTDIYYIYREGFKKYYIKSFLKVVTLLVIIMSVPIITYWGVLNILPTTSKIFIEGVASEAEGIASSITILNNSIKNLAIHNPNRYVYYTMAVFIISGVNYGIYTYALGNLMKSKIFRYLAPAISLTIIDFIVGMIIGMINPNFNASVLFDTFNTVVLLDNSYIIVFNLCLFLFSLLLVFIHYVKRTKEG
ncbi:hypothetical protein ACOAKC_04335 [Hathewaya histolytica]|uniref:hypothetical protein n=1 Tax=Hathewaya histolytica TaxID=1498 RepID=UPI003B66EA0E